MEPQKLSTDIACESEELSWWSLKETTEGFTFVN